MLRSFSDRHFSVYVAVYQQLLEYEQKIFGSNESSNPTPPVFPPAGDLSFSFGFPKANDSIPVPAFNSAGATSIFARPSLGVPHEFAFGAGSGSPLNSNPLNSNASDIQMDSS